MSSVFSHSYVTEALGHRCRDTSADKAAGGVHNQAVPSC